MLNLCSWGNAWIVHKLNPSSLWHRRKLILSQDKYPETQGFATYESVYGIHSRFYAVYGYEDRLYFQSGRKRWDFTDDEIDIEIKLIYNGMASKVKVYQNKKLVHQAFFVHILRGVFMAIDPTYDGIDAEDSFFFLFLKNQMPDLAWRERVISRSNKFA